MNPFRRIFRYRSLTATNVGISTTLVRLMSAGLGASRSVTQALRPFPSYRFHSLTKHSVSFASFARVGLSPNSEMEGIIIGCRTSPNNDLLTVEFSDGTFTFHAQWLYDARCDDGPSRNAASAFCQQAQTACIQAARVAGEGSGMTLEVTWGTGQISRFPGPWMRVLAPLVAKPKILDAKNSAPSSNGWLVNTLDIPEVQYGEIFPEKASLEQSEATTIRILDDLLHDSSAGIVKITGMPPPNVEDERNKENTLVTRVLKKIFGGVFVHPRRGADRTFNVASHHQDDTKRAIGLPNYDTNQTLLPHADHAHYDHPVQVMGFYGLEGESENTFVSGLAVLATFRDEAPELFKQLCNAPVAIGRVAPYYNPPMNQATVDTAITTYPGFPDKVKRFRWHPHLSGSLLSPFDDFHLARDAYQKFQEIMRRDTHQLKVLLKPGDLYLWDNFRLLHGRERVLKVPRTGVGQTVPEQVVTNRYRELKINRLKRYIDERWLVHVPMPQLNELLALLEVGQTTPNFG